MRGPCIEELISIVPCFVSVVEQEVESEAGEVSDEDMLATGKEDDASEEEELNCCG